MQSNAIFHTIHLIVLEIKFKTLPRFILSLRQWRNWRGGRGQAAPWQAKCKNWDPFSWNFDIYYSFGFQLVAVFLLFWRGSFFFNQFRHPRHPGSLSLLSFFWVLAGGPLYSGQWLPSAKFCSPWPKPLDTPLARGVCNNCSWQKSFRSSYQQFCNNMNLLSSLHWRIKGVEVWAQLLVPRMFVTPRWMAPLWHKCAPFWCVMKKKLRLKSILN